MLRHSFGNMRDLLREVAYSGIMGAYLTFARSASYAATATDADENFSREIMQLFTIGLYELSSDGSYELDNTGKPIETYTTPGIRELARCWTGFEFRPMRPNMHGFKHMVCKPQHPRLLPKASPSTTPSTTLHQPPPPPPGQ